LPLAPSDLRDARAYLAALGYDERIAVHAVPGWRTAEAILRN